MCWPAAAAVPSSESETGRGLRRERLVEERSGAAGAESNWDSHGSWNGRVTAEGERLDVGDSRDAGIAVDSASAEVGPAVGATAAVLAGSGRSSRHSRSY
jgi:hypothetical protein